eukprot:5317008-Amphidinium_carterae.1
MFCSLGSLPLSPRARRPASVMQKRMIGLCLLCLVGLVGSQQHERSNGLTALGSTATELAIQEPRRLTEEAPP